jgi:hypothetical protein
MSRLEAVRVSEQSTTYPAAQGSPQVPHTIIKTRAHNKLMHATQECLHSERKLFLAVVHVHRLGRLVVLELVGSHNLLSKERLAVGLEEAHH